jgi:hypothetical protein
LIPACFDLWKKGLVLDRETSLEDSKSVFEKAASAFFDDASGERKGVGRALLEYSTLMDAFAAVQEGRILKGKMEYDESLDKFARASEILRATVHHAFLASYTSGCASLETASEMEDDDDKFQGFRNAIALFEQSKLALSFRDEKHTLMRSIDALIKFSISRALLVESEKLGKKGALSDSRKKRELAETVEGEFRSMTATGKGSPVSRFKIDYFLKGYECERATSGSFLTTFPERNLLWIGNVGIHAAKVESLGTEQVGAMLLPYDSTSWQLTPAYRGRLRIVYTDEVNKNRYDEGTLTVI